MKIKCLLLLFVVSPIFASYEGNLNYSHKFDVQYGSGEKYTTRGVFKYSNPQPKIFPMPPYVPPHVHPHFQQHYSYLHPYNNYRDPMDYQYSTKVYFNPKKGKQTEPETVELEPEKKWSLGKFNRSKFNRSSDQTQINGIIRKWNLCKKI